MRSVSYERTSTWTGKQIACAALSPSFVALNRDGVMHAGGPTG
jgi:hypothetical protein